MTQPSHAGERLFQSLKTSIFASTKTLPFTGRKSAMLNSETEAPYKLPPTTSPDPSVVFITMHKAGSSFVNDAIRDLLVPAGRVHVDFATEAFENGFNEAEYCVSRASALATPGYYFGAFRGAYVQGFENLSKNRVVIQVRDPRDCIVSLYFSQRFSHPDPGNGEYRQEFNEWRAKVAAQEIDEFALGRAIPYERRMLVILDLLKKYPEALLLKYEDMVLRFDDWFRTLANFLDVPVAPAVENSIRRMAAYDNQSEDVTRHKRQVIPGDFMRKLKPETQAALTRQLEPQLRRFRYL